MQKWSRRALLVGGLALLGAGCTHAVAGQSPYSIGVRGEGNEVTIAPDSGTTHRSAARSYTVAVTSTSGIGQAIVAWWDWQPPQQLTFRLELQGLEHFQLRWEDTLINVSVNTSTQHIMQSVQKGDAAENALVATSPFWMETHLYTAESAGFSIVTPTSFAQDGPRVWAIGWVDFYR